MAARTKNVLVVVGPGQSNETGTSEEPHYAAGLGCPLRDPVLPNGIAGSRSMWPLLAELAGQRGVWLNVRNHGVGATSCAVTWCGMARTWVSGQIHGPGSYAIRAGSVYKATVTPAGTLAASTVAPAVGAQADGFTWALARAVTAEDTDGHVYDRTSALFDPNGYLAGCAASFAAAVGYDLKVSLISIGQTDKSYSVTRAQYGTALQNAVAYLLAAGADKVALGFTCYGATAGMSAWYDAELTPGRDDALAALAGDSRVFAGANLYTTLGVLPVNPANRETAGLRADQLHMNNAALALASRAWFDNLVVNGII